MTIKVNNKGCCMSKFQDTEKIKKTNDEKYKEKLASDVVDILLQREIDTLMSNNKGKGWICGFGMEGRIRCAKYQVKFLKRQIVQP